MDTLKALLNSDRKKCERRIDAINADLVHQTESIRNVADNASAIEILRKLPGMLEDLKIQNAWLHEEQQKLQELDSYLAVK